MRTHILRCTALLLLAAGCRKAADKGSDAVTTPLHQEVAQGSAAHALELLERGADMEARDLSGKTPLFIAASGRGPQGKSHREMVSFLLDHGAYVDTSDKWGNSVLHGALSGGQADVAKLLIERGAYVRTQNQSGETPLHEAARSGWLELVKLLVARGANVNVVTRTGDMPLMYALEPTQWRTSPQWLTSLPGDEHMKVIRFLISKGADVNAMNKTGDTPLGRAAEYGDLELAQLLAASGAKPSPGVAPDRNPAVIAMNHDHPEVARFLVDQGADITLPLAAYIGDSPKAQALIQAGADANACSEALYMAAKTDHRDIAELLIDNGADVNDASRGGWMPLHEAASHGHKDIVELLIARGAAVNARTTGRRTPPHSYGNTPGTTPLYVAVKYPDVVKVLIDHGADLNAKEVYYSETPIQRAVYLGDRRVVHLLAAAGADMDPNLAAYMGYTERVKRLIEAGADVNTRDKHGQTPLYFAVLGGHADVVELLTGSDADPTIVYYDDDYGENQTLLHKAAQMDCPDVARVLIAHGANVQVRDRSGDTPLHTAAYFGRARMVEMLLAHGGDPNARTTGNKTPLDYAQEAGFEDVVRLLGGDTGKLARGPYRVIVNDPNAIQAFLGRSMSVEQVWTPDQAQLQEFEIALKTYLQENASPNSDNEQMLVHLRRFHREYAGLTSRGKRYIVCSLDLGDLDKNPPENPLTRDRAGSSWTFGHVIYDADANIIIRVDHI